MAELKKFSRSIINGIAKDCGVELPKEFIDELMNLHSEVRDAYAETQVEAAKKSSESVDVKESEEYKTLEKEYNDYKAEIANKQAKEAKEKAVRAFYESKGITGKYLEIAMRGSRAEIDGIELDGDKIKDSSALDALVKGDFSGLVATTTTKGADTANPPANNGGKTGKTKEEIMAIRDPAVRQAEIAKNPEVFGLKFD